MRTAIALSLIAVMAVSGAAMASNTPVAHTAQPFHEKVSGILVDNVLVYSDDCYGQDYVLDALGALGVGYTLYYADPYGFEGAVASGSFNRIFVSSECYFEISYSWDNLVTAYMGGARIAVAAFDWDGSNDYSGSVGALLALGGHTEGFDVQYQGPVYVWNQDPIFTGCGAVLNPVYPDYYIDEGDGWYFGTAEAGWTQSPTQPYASCNIAHGLVLIGFTVDELSQTDGQCVWENVIQFILAGPSATEPSTWGSVKSLYN